MKAFKVWVRDLDAWHFDDMIITEAYFESEESADKYREELKKELIENNEMTLESFDSRFELKKEEIKIY